MIPGWEPIRDAVHVGLQLDVCEYGPWEGFLFTEVGFDHGVSLVLVEFKLVE